MPINPATGDWSWRKASLRLARAAESDLDSEGKMEVLFRPWVLLKKTSNIPRNVSTLTEVNLGTASHVKVCLEYGG